MRRLLLSLVVMSLVHVTMPLRAQDKFFDSNGVRIRYIEQGSGQPVVLIHGFSGSVERPWIDSGVLAKLASDHRVIALDCRGFGKSGKPYDPKAYGAEMGQDVVRLLDHLQIRRAHIVGYSMGAVIAAKLLTTNPDRFLTATLLSSSGQRAWTPQNERDAEAAAVEFEHGVPFRSLLLATAPSDAAPPTEDAVRKRSQELLAVNDPVALAAWYRGRSGLVESSAQMAAVKVPTLGVIGSADPNLAGMKELKTILPALKVVVIDGATHAGDRAAFGRPEFINALCEFLAAHGQI